MAKAASSGPRRRRKTSTKTAGRKTAGGRLWFWLLALVVVLGGIVAHDNSKALRRFVATNFPSLSATPPASKQAFVSHPDTTASPARPQAKPPVPPLPVGRGREAATVEEVLASLPSAPVASAASENLVGRGYRNTFYFCGTSGLDNCVADGGVFWFQKQQIRLADVVAPKTENAPCDSERQKGFAAKVRLRDLLNQGSFDLVDWPNADGDGRGRKLRVVLRNGQSIGQQLVREGLVHGVSDAGKPWCG